MDVAQITEEIEVEEIHQHILKFEPPKHSIDALERLNGAADYIFSEFRSFGLRVNEQRFKIECAR